MKRAFAALTVKSEDIESRYKTDIDKLTLGEMEDLRKIYDLLKSGDANKEEYFNEEQEWQE